MTTSRPDSVVRAPLDRLLAQVERQVSRRIEATVAAEGLTVDQWRVLHLLADGSGRTMSAIAAAIAVPGPTLTKVVDRLVDVASVYRLPDVQDRRRVLVFLSDGGRATHDRLVGPVCAVEAEVLGILGPEAALLLDLLDRLAART
ncbi:MarR family transcriptional regulator [Pseudonocardia sp.]|uniref:MarR family winged helix-turn-helix transcriptional regulator n=1 Tax=Pseudonocardia sp. TaxID=60912 RepID=UPI00260C6F06|nr:MarR family transcriptional regulator [Pseudonocardia sp.]